MQGYPEPCVIRGKRRTKMVGKTTVLEDGVRKIIKKCYKKAKKILKKRERELDKIACILAERERLMELISADI